MDYRPISADSHMDMAYIPADTFTSRVSAEWQGRMPRVVDGDDGPVWVGGSEGQYAIGAWGIHGRRGKPTGVRMKAMRAAGFIPENRRPADPVARLEDQEADGVDAEVIYGIFTLSGTLKDGDAAAMAFHAYNDYIAEFCLTQPDRYVGLGCIPGNNVESAVAEVEHIAKLGLKGAEWSYLDTNTPIWHPQWEPLWAAVEDAGIVLSLHVRLDTTTTLRGIPGSEDPAVTAAWLSVGPMQLDEALVSVIFCGALERHPKLKVVIAEGGVGWIPYVLDRMDYEWEDHPDEWPKFVKTLPSDLFRRQMYATFQKDAPGPLLAEKFCPDNFMWGSDYPHPDGVWPDSLETIDRYLGDVGPDMRRKIVRDNVAALYGLGA